MITVITVKFRPFMDRFGLFPVIALFRGSIIAENTVKFRPFMYRFCVTLRMASSCGSVITLNTVKRL